MQFSSLRDVFAPLRPLDWLDWHTRFLFFTGKGGVGKTTISSTVALRLAETGRRILLVSTDPASNLDDVFGLTASSTVTAVPGVEGLFLMNLDPEASAAAYRERVIGPYRETLPAAIVQNMEEQLSGACTVEIAAFNEFTRLLSDAPLVQQYDHIIFDTAPTGHTLRLLSLPRAWSGFVATSTHGASCLGPLAGLEAQREHYAATVQALSDATQTTLVLVSRPEESPLREAARTSEELQTLHITNQRLILNGLFPDVQTQDSVAQALVERQGAALLALPEPLRVLPLRTVPLVASNLTGLAALRALAQVATSDPMTRGSHEGEQDAPERSTDDGLDALVRQLTTKPRGVILTMGKGGVGKTTVAAALALALAKAGHRVHLSTTDPAAHLDHTVGTTPFPHLMVSRIDPLLETERYTQEVLSAAGPLDEEGRALLKEDLRSPCTEEIAVFRAFARTVQEAEDGFVVLDTAPTGHTLLLLDAAEHYHREVQRTTGQVPEAVRALLPRLRDPEYTKVILITLAETTPVSEAERLQTDLRRAGIEPYGWVMNASLSASQTRHPLLAQRALLEQPHIQHVEQHLAKRTWLVPWYEQAPTGEQALLTMTH
ncbi:arsenical pump-driving ATPase [Ktedonobacter sp. SOSP1-52]|uniref:arsenical pump-driving ATPase n=1 Tax=Ktedonobacter sp. SOSP1-52 TaxID=2778366 RepID=UPI001915DB70|nr:arsenical pump-driving ATPase [Ktedonobacter sp. SOSP1-52]GHO63630.1 arsenical pump-driving ATPase [Ktedonobacter sp. SOSP1-52]